jgi:hypothetical protein
VGFGDEGVERLQAPEQWVDVARIGHVVSVVGHRGLHHGAQPQGVDPEQFEVAEFVDHARYVADPVTVVV